jgi:hypothetical protein
MKTSNLAAAAALQVLIFLYFWSIGTSITSEPDFRKWPEAGRIALVGFSALFGTLASIGYLTMNNDGRK